MTRERHNFRPQSVLLKTRRTSLRLEPYMWDALDDICRREGRSLGEICSEVDATRGELGLTAALRIFIVRYFREGGPGAGPPSGAGPV